MKKQIKLSLGIVLLTILLSINIPANANVPPPPPPPGHGESGNVPGGGAPIGEGLMILAALGAAYGYKKWKASDKEE
jgi:hypothetical protein